TPPGRPPVGRHDVLRQARAMALVQDAVPVPRLLATSEDPPWFAMSFERGEASEPAHDPVPSGDDPGLVTARFRAATVLLARLHEISVEPLLDVEPAVGPAEELGKWTRVLDAIDGSFLEIGRRAHDQLAATVPA